MVIAPSSAMLRRSAFVIDPSAAFRERVAISLRKDGYRVRTFSSLKKALVAIARILARASFISNPYGIWLNLQPNHISGLGVLSALGSATERVPFIFVTSSRDRSTLVRATHLGAIKVHDERAPYAFIARLIDAWSHRGGIPL